jgi:hypothetical protein
VAYRADVEFLKDCSPALIERNAQEFERMRNLLDSVEPSVTKAKDNIQWESIARAGYDARLGDVKALVGDLGAGFDKARTALLGYADEVEAAKRHLEVGLKAESRLDELVSSVADAVTRTAQKAEPMRRWEDIRSTTGFFDWVAELGMDVDSIRDEANRAYEQAGDAFGRAQSTEKHGREECLAKLRAAYEALPDFRGGDFRDAKDMVDDIPELGAEVKQAENDPNTHLSGSGTKGDLFPGADNKDVSPALERIRELLKSLPEGKGDWESDARSGGNLEWIKNNKELIMAAARETGLPPDMIAGIAYMEVGGKPYALDDVTEQARAAAENWWSPKIPENLPGPLGGERDATSHGPMAVQIRRAAEVLGYDPENLTDGQRDEIRSALKDPAQNIFIASEYLANLKAESEFANVPADQMTPAQYQELAARYNGGPYWEGGHAQDYGKRFEEHRSEAGQALQ